MNSLEQKYKEQREQELSAAYDKILKICDKTFEGESVFSAIGVLVSVATGICSRYPEKTTILKCCMLDCIEECFEKLEKQKKDYEDG